MTTASQKHLAATPQLERVVVFHDFSQAMGGASYLVQVLLEQLCASNIPVTFFCGDDGANFHRDDVEFIPLGGKALTERSALGGASVGLYNPACPDRVGKWIEKNDSPGTVYHLHGWSKIFSPSIFIPLRRVSDRLILHGHDYFNGCPNGAFFDYMADEDCDLVPLSGSCLRKQCDKSSYAQKYWRSAREAFRRCAAGGGVNVNRLLLIHPGQAARFSQARWPAEKMVAIRNPVTPPCSERVRAEDNDEILFIGRISAEKGADLAAIAAGKAQMPITFVGDGIEMDRVRALNPHAQFLGHQNRPGVAKALRRARLAVMPSRWSEPFGLVALEAAGSGVPVIVNNRALIAQEVQEAGFGISLNTQNIDDFVGAINMLRNDRRVAEEMSQRGRCRYLDLCNTNASWSEKIIDQYNIVIQGS